MNWFSHKYTYLLVALAIVVSVGLQIAWVSQLFRSQQEQVKLDLETAAGNAAKMSNYLSLAPGHEQSKNFKAFFLGKEWLQFKQAFSNMRFHNIGSRFNEEIIGDSTIVDISLRVPNNNIVYRKHGHIQRWYDPGENLASVSKADSADLVRMDSLVRYELLKYHLKVDSRRVLYNYDNDVPLGKYKSEISNAAFHSQQYTYNLRFLHTYQLVVSSVFEAVIYRMRFYLISSLFMLALTGAAFFLLYRLIRSQRLYAQARISFTSNMTHELKTPVSVIEAALDAITRYDLTHQPDKLYRYISVSLNELQRLNLMIEKVLDLDHLDNGQLKLRLELYDIQQGIEQVVTSMRLRAEKDTVRLTYMPSQEPCFVNGDPVHLTNVFYNLIENAIKFGGYKVEIKVTCTCDSESVRISVNDNGPGIEAVYHQRIFERFYRVQNNPDVHNVKGSGLGLHYVKQVIEQHGGNVDIRSSLGKGSNFVIDLPIYDEI